MKKTFVLLAAAIFLFAGVCVSADESVVIDFTLLDADIIVDADGNPTQNRRTAMDYSVAALASFNPEQRAALRTSLALREWEVHLNSSARSVESLSKSGVRAVPVRTEAQVPFAGKNIMGVRILFPSTNAHANARVVPSFAIPAYEAYAETDENGDRPGAAGAGPNGEVKLFEGGYGLVRNVGVIRAIQVTAYGNSFPYALYVILKDQDEVEHRYLMGSMGFDGWKEMRWTNPDYISDVRGRVSALRPLYPQMELPFVTFVGFQVVRDPMVPGGDFISYFKDVKIIYDRAQDTSERDIAEEDVWGIIENREKGNQQREMEKFGAKQIGRYIAKEKVAAEQNFTSSLESEQ
ncbi:MAG: flagellar filament outer layer protein FlaA [Spirochaetaceae bacterium]|jgi:hypothetical protein|nr:flagellar filament outer layer protein FlaA [Spirochaetaceae bacterium]